MNPTRKDLAMTIIPDGLYPVYNPDGSFKRYTTGAAILELQEAGLMDEDLQPTKKARAIWSAKKIPWREQKQ